MKRNDILSHNVNEFRDAKETAKALVQTIDPIKVQEVRDKLDFLEKYDEQYQIPANPYFDARDMESVIAELPFAVPVCEFTASLKASSGKYYKTTPTGIPIIAAIKIEYRNDRERRFHAWGEEYADVLLHSDVLGEGPYERHDLIISGNFTRFEGISTWYIPANQIIAVPRKVILMVNYKCRRKILSTATDEEKKLFFDNKMSDQASKCHLMTSNRLGGFANVHSSEGRPRYHFVAA